MAVEPSSSPQHRRLQLQLSSNNNNTSGTATSEVILGLRNDARYREIMYQQFNILGTTRDAAREEMVACDLFNRFQREGAQLYRMERNGKRMRLDDEEALKRITKHLKRRTESSHIWLGKSNNCNASHQQDTKTSSQTSISEFTEKIFSRSNDHSNNALTRHESLHKKDEHLSTTRPIMAMPQDPFTSNLESPSELHAEEKKQDDDAMGLGIRSSSAAPTDANRSSIRSCNAEHTTCDVYPHVTESDLSSWEGNLNTDCQNNAPSYECNEMPPSEIKEITCSDRIILSLNDEYYKKIMWRHYRILGKTRDSDREARIGNEIFSIFKRSLGPSGRFFKRAQDLDFEVNDETALAKIIADIRRRMKNYPKWSGSPQKLVQPQSISPPALVGKTHAEALSPRLLRRDYRTEALALRNGNDVPTIVRKRSTRSLTASDPALNISLPSSDDTILSLSNEKYKEVMLRYYTILGNKQRGGKFKEENVAQQIFRLLKKSMCEGGRFFVKISHGDVLHPVDDARALQTISRDIKRRDEVMQNWLNHGSNDEFNADHAENTATVSLPITQHHAWRDQLSASPIDVTGKVGCSIPIDMLIPSVPKPSSCPSFRQGTKCYGPYQLCPLGEKIMEEYFQHVGERLVEIAQHDGFGFDRKKDACDIFTEVTPQIQDQLCVRQQPETESNSDTALSSDHKSNFLRHFQSNSARLADLQSKINTLKDSELSALRLSCALKRVKVGSKDRVLCMVADCEKHAQTRCNGCCTAHFRLLNSTPVKQQPSLPPKNGRTPSKKSMTEILPPNQASIEFVPLPDGECPDKKSQVVSFITEINSSSQSLGEEHTTTAPFRSNMLTLSPAQRIYTGNDAKTSVERSMITISPITTAQSEKAVNPGISLHNQVQRRLEGFSSLSGSLDCLDCPGTEAYIKNSAQSPIGVQAVNTLPPKNSPGVNSAFTSPKRIARPPLFHELYRPSATSPKRVHFPGIRSASSGRNQRICLKAEHPLTLRTCLQPTTGAGAKMSEWRLPDGHKNAGAGKVVLTNTRKSKRISQSISPIEDLDSSHSFRRPHAVQSTSALCHCPVCNKGNLNVQGMYAHYGRSHNGTLPWLEVNFSCPFCPTTSMSRSRLFGSFRDLEAHVNAKHPGCEVIGPHPSKLVSSTLNRNSLCAKTEAIPNNVRVLRERKVAPDGVSESSGQHQLRVIDPKVVTTKQSVQSWSKLEYPHYNSKDIPVIDEQRHSQEEIVEAARDQRVNLCRNEAEVEFKLFEEERLAYLRGIRERTRLADGERIEKQKFTEKADQLMMLYQYENRNRKRSREEVEFDKLCARSVIFSNEATRRERKFCPDDRCQFCQVDNKRVRQLMIGSENEDRKKVEVLLPSYRIAEDIFSLHAGVDCVKDDTSVTSAETRSAKSRRAVSTAKRIKTEEDKLLMLKNTQLCLEFIKKYNGGMILNAWGGTRNNKKRKIIA